MLALNRKLLRNLRQAKGQAVAISLVIAAGVSMFIMYFSTFESLQVTRAAYYESYRFADVFASLKRAPRLLRERIERIPGVARVEARVIVDVTLDVEGLITRTYSLGQINEGFDALDRGEDGRGIIRFDGS